MLALWSQGKLAGSGNLAPSTEWNGTSWVMHWNHFWLGAAHIWQRCTGDGGIPFLPLSSKPTRNPITPFWFPGLLVITVHRQEECVLRFRFNSFSRGGGWPLCRVAGISHGTSYCSQNMRASSTSSSWAFIWLFPQVFREESFSSLAPQKVENGLFHDSVRVC